MLRYGIERSAVAVAGSQMQMRAVGELYSKYNDAWRIVVNSDLPNEEKDRLCNALADLYLKRVGVLLLGMNPYAVVQDPELNKAIHAIQYPDIAMAL